MTVKELRQKLAKLDGQTRVVVYWEDGVEQTFFEIDDVSLAKGEPMRDKSGKPAFKFDSSGPVEWLFIGVSRDEGLGPTT
jgi:hypothetical protein